MSPQFPTATRRDAAQNCTPATLCKGARRPGSFRTDGYKLVRIVLHRRISGLSHLFSVASTSAVSLFRYGVDEEDELDGASSFPDTFRGLQGTFDSPGRGPNSSRQHLARAEQPPAPYRQPKTPFSVGTSPGGVENGLGTWGNRQKVFARVSAEPEPSENCAQPQHIAFAGALLEGSHVNQPIDCQPAPPVHVQREDSEDADINAAWRWRFTRKWQQEQLRQLDPAASAADEDDWATAMDYMAAAAGGADLQFGRTTSMDNGGSQEASLSHSMALLLDASMSKDLGVSEFHYFCQFFSRLFSK